MTCVLFANVSELIVMISLVAASMSHYKTCKSGYKEGQGVPWSLKGASTSSEESRQALRGPGFAALAGFATATLGPIFLQLSVNISSMAWGLRPFVNYSRALRKPSL